MAVHVVVGAGPVGREVAGQLAARGDEAVVVSRRGTAPEGAGIRGVALDALDTAALVELTTGARALFNCANPPYHRWPTDWPPLAASLLATASVTGAVLVTTSNLYGYGPVDGPMTEDLPLAARSRKGRVRAAMWDDALAAHRAGRAAVAEVRASDFFGGPDVASILTEMVVPAVTAGRRALVPCDPDAPHTWTYVPDLARTLVAVAANPSAWGRAWHAPSPEPLSIRAMASLVAGAAGAGPARVSQIPAAAVWAAGLASPRIREFREVAYQFRRPFVMDSGAARRDLGLAPTPLDEAVGRMVAAFGRQEAALAA